MFSREQILDLKSKLDYRKFYSQYLQLYQQGSNVFAQCCFHSNDNSPSLCISPETGVFHCFACGEHGDVIDFYQKITGKNFVDSIIDIAKSQDIQIEISEELKREFEYKKALAITNLQVATLYQKALAQNKEGQDYLISRHFDLPTIQKFKIGYVPNFKLANLGPQFIPLLKENELIIENEDGTYRNYFSSHRISIPFFDEYGKIVGFSSRVTNANLKPKYLHSRTSTIFKKDELLYAYNFAKDVIKETKSVIICEGQIDCIRAHQYGINNCVATCGLALSDKQIKLLKTDVKNYYLVVEDQAGENAIDRLYDKIIETSFWSNVKIIRLYQGNEKCDLDEFLTKYGKIAFLDKIKHAPTYHEYKLIDSLKNINYSNIEQKKFHIYNNRKYISKITNPIDKKQYIELLAEKLELPENDVRKVISKYELTDGNIKVGEYDDRRITSEKYILASFFSCFGADVAYSINQKLKTRNKLDNKFAKIYDKIEQIILLYGAKSDIINIIHSTDTATDEELKIIDDAYFKNDEFQYLSDSEELEAFLIDQINNLK